MSSAIYPATYAFDWMDTKTKVFLGHKSVRINRQQVDTPKHSPLVQEHKSPLNAGRDGYEKLTDGTSTLAASLTSTVTDQDLFQLLQAKPRSWSWSLVSSREGIKDVPDQGTALMDVHQEGALNTFSNRINRIAPAKPVA